MRPRNVIAIVLTLLSFVLLIPGLTKPLITISATFSFLGNTTEIFRETRSILGSIRTLHDSGNDFVAGLILLFSVLVPFIKGAILGAVAVSRRPALRYRLYLFVRSISKWAMADVFAVGVYIAFLAAKATDRLDAKLHGGFFWFVGYCVVSLAALQFARVDAPISPPSREPA